jgi:SulP family sulfate permease
MALGAFGSTDRAFLTVVAGTLVITVLVGVASVALGRFRLDNLIRFVPYPVAGGLLAGAGWLLVKGGVAFASGVVPAIDTISELRADWMRWLPALAFGVLILLASRIVRRPLVVPVMIGIGLLLFAAGVLVTGSTIDTARDGGWLVGPFDSTRLLEPWTLRAVSGADWAAVLGAWAGIAVAIFVALIAMSFAVNGSETVLARDLDANEELRDAGLANIVAGAVGATAGYHTIGATSLARSMRARARTVGLVAAFIPLAAVAFGGAVVELIPRMLVASVLVFLGLALIIEWVWDRRRVMARIEYAVVLLILVTVIARGFMQGTVFGLVLAVVLFAISYGRVELVREVDFGDAYRSNVDRSAGERSALRAMADRVQVVRVQGFVFFGTASGLLDRIRGRVEQVNPRFLVVDLRRVTGVDSSAVVSFVKVVRLAKDHGFEVVLTGGSDPVRRQLERGGVVDADGLVRFEPDLDRGLQRVEDGLLSEGSAAGEPESPDELPHGLRPHLEREEISEGTVLIRQDESAADMFVLEAGRLAVELETPEGTRVRLATIRPGVMVGEVAFYAGGPRTASVVAETPSVVLRLTGESIQRLETSDPALAARVHRWLATAMSDRLGATERTFETLLD